MHELTAAKRGDWVEVERTILEPGERSPQVPADTASLPYVARIQGFAVTEGRLGERLEIETLIGRHLEGTLVAVNPSYRHDFGRPVPELLAAGRDARRLLEEASA